MPSFQYRALTRSGELVSGSISAPTVSEVAERIEYLGVEADHVLADVDAEDLQFGADAFGRGKLG